MKPYEELFEQQKYIVVANEQVVELFAQLSSDSKTITYSWTHPVTQKEYMGEWKSKDENITPPVAWKLFNAFLPQGVIAPIREEVGYKE